MECYGAMMRVVEMWYCMCVFACEGMMRDCLFDDKSWVGRCDMSRDEKVGDKKR